MIKGFYLWPFDFTFIWCGISFGFKFMFMIRPNCYLLFGIGPATFEIQFCPKGPNKFSLHDLPVCDEDKRDW